MSIFSHWPSSRHCGCVGYICNCCPRDEKARMSVLSQIVYIYRTISTGDIVSTLLHSVHLLSQVIRSECKYRALFFIIIIVSVHEARTQALAAQCCVYLLSQFMSGERKHCFVLYCVYIHDTKQCLCSPLMRLQHCLCRQELSIV